LVDLGYWLGETLTLVTRFVAPEPKALEDAIRVLVKEIDLLVTWSTLAGVAAKKVARDIPVVFISVGRRWRLGSSKVLLALAAKRQEGWWVLDRIGSSWPVRAVLSFGQDVPVGAEVLTQRCTARAV
jgi:hypothetical protein